MIMLSSTSNTVLPESGLETAFLSAGAAFDGLASGRIDETKREGMQKSASNPDSR